MGQTKEQMKITVADNLSCVALLLPSTICWLGFAATLLILTSKGVGAEGTKKEYRWKQIHSTGHGLKQLESKDAYFDLRHIRSLNVLKVIIFLPI
jgi:hypothetical protein